MAAHGDDQVDGSEERRGEDRTVEETAGAGAAPPVSLTTKSPPTPPGTASQDGPGDASDGDRERDGSVTEGDEDEPELPEPRTGMTPRQARRVRAVVSGVVMCVVAVALVLRLGSAPSLLTVGGYGVALILSGTAIVLSRRGRTRVATAVLACGFVTIILAERALAGA
ncbi:hypothetical protein RM572_14825 [Streptomyces sp. DSM 42041]|uniref:Uncharacterized protein n=1 Tax=Streptomyces hazeniae TaxID=3075538 RepID=A0ABU2NTI4_9ACTN|nr:hypothetical protein [Streptomyces sp. DSM 42041]MDT0380035.1 hypothetical protein [Streptomyces sp. DSM 42041]